jgi:(S)-ureidoglycine-glyoxylate aminotransferase
MVAGVEAMGLQVYGDRAHKMPHVTGIHIPKDVEGEGVRTRMRDDFGIEIGTSFGPLHGKIWRIGCMGYNCTKPNVLTTLNALEASLRNQEHKVKSGAAVDAALRTYAEAV